MSGSSTVVVRRPLPARRLPRAAAFVAVIATMLLFQAASSALTPLFVVYQRLWGFSSATVTVVFAVFVVGLLAALLTLGALSDHVGRRPVLLTSLALEAVALVIFLAATDVTALLVARAVEGVATGMVLPTLGAMLVDFDPPQAPGRASVASGVVPIGGLAAGSLGCGALTQYAPDPTRLVWAMLLGVTVLALVVTLSFPESSPGRAGALQSLVPRLGVPRQLRRDVAGLVPRSSPAGPSVASTSRWAHPPLRPRSRSPIISSAVWWPPCCAAPERCPRSSCAAPPQPCFDGRAPRCSRAARR